MMWSCSPYSVEICSAVPWTNHSANTRVSSILVRNTSVPSTEEDIIRLLLMACHNRNTILFGSSAKGVSHMQAFVCCFQAFGVYYSMCHDAEEAWRNNFGGWRHISLLEA